MKNQPTKKILFNNYSSSRLGVAECGQATLKFVLKGGTEEMHDVYLDKDGTSKTFYIRVTDSGAETETVSVKWGTGSMVNGIEDEDFKNDDFPETYLVLERVGTATFLSKPLRLVPQPKERILSRVSGASSREVRALYQSWGESEQMLTAVAKIWKLSWLKLRVIDRGKDVEAALTVQFSTDGSPTVHPLNEHGKAFAHVQNIKVAGDALAAQVTSLDLPGVYEVVEVSTP